MPSWAMERALQGELTGLVNFQRAPKDFAAAAERNRSARRKNLQRPLKTEICIKESSAGSEINLELTFARQKKT